MTEAEQRRALALAFQAASWALGDAAKDAPKMSPEQWEHLGDVLRTLLPVIDALAAKEGATDDESG